MITKDHIQDILADKSPEHLEDMAQKAKEITEQYFGRTISLYTPLYISNYCDSHCVYCGFNTKNKKLVRKKLTQREMKDEMERIASFGIQNILLLTGESDIETPSSYIAQAVKVAKTYFPSIQIEVNPLKEEEYRNLCSVGVDGVAIYQETYNRDIYQQVHLSGQKSDYDYRYQTPERIALSGIRQISMGILLGLAPVEEDLYLLYQHLSNLIKKYPGVEYSLSFPRINSLQGHTLKYQRVSDITLIKIICLSRILFPHVGINLSTREREFLRDRAIHLGITRLSAASSTKVGGYTRPGTDNTQFDIQDFRSVDEITQSIKQNKHDPVYTDWRRIEYEEAL